MTSLFRTKNTGKAASFLTKMANKQSTAPVSSQISAVVALFFVVASFSSKAAANQLLSQDRTFGSQSLSQAQTTLFPVCIDDSDCKKLGQGNKYACFQYLCYPWRDDSGINPKDRLTTCRRDSDCSEDQECFRHHDKRHVNKGLCFDKMSECSEGDESDCPEGKGCCGGTCCDLKYAAQFRSLPCTSHYGCQDLNLGQYCCPRKNDTSTCCNTNPNPPTTPNPRPSAISKASQEANQCAFNVLLFSLLAAATFGAGGAF